MLERCLKMMTNSNEKLTAGKDFDPYPEIVDFETLSKDIQDYLKWIRPYFSEDKKVEIKEKPIVYDGGYFYINEARFGALNMGTLSSGDGNFKIDFDNAKIEIKTEELEPETEFETWNGAEYSIFECDENKGTYHLEIDPNWLWGKDDLRDLANHLIKIIDDDSDASQQTDYVFNEAVIEPIDKKEKPLFVITSPYGISEEAVKGIKEVTEKALKEANIDAVPLILSDDLKTRFERP